MNYDLIFAGGGAKGIVHVGALQALEARGHGFRRVIGTSAGAITALLLAAGYNADEILTAVSEKLPGGQAILASFMDVPDTFDEESIRNSITLDKLQGLTPSFLSVERSERVKTSMMDWLLKNTSYRELFSFVQFGGIYSGDKFVVWLREKLEDKTPGLGEATLADFHQQTGSDFTAVATDTDDGVMLAFNHRTAPDLPVAWAVRMSMGIPFVYQEVIWKPQWGLFLGRNIDGHAVVDGGLASNLPIELALSDDPAILEVMGGAPESDRVIGLLIDITLPVPGAEATTPQTPSLSQRLTLGEHWSILETRISNLINTSIRSSDNLEALMHPENVCRLPAGGYDTMEFDMSEERSQLLVAAGRMAMTAYLEPTSES